MRLRAPCERHVGPVSIRVADPDARDLAALLIKITAKLADPRRINDSEAKQLISDGKVFYWASGSIHSPETGSPEMLMELAYRLAVDESAYIRQIRDNVITLITPIVEVDGVTHSTAVAMKRDEARTQLLESLGFLVVRVSNTDVYDNLDGVLEMIDRTLRAP